MKFLITGANGQLGRAAAEVFSGNHTVVTLSRKDMDITRKADVENAFQSFTPDIVLNCAAYTRVDEAEEQKDTAWDINVGGPENLARCVQTYGGRLIHISTDYVFDGRRALPRPYAEDDDPKPESYYGKTKHAGEKIIRSTTPDHLIVRTAWLYGIDGHNFLKTILKRVLKEPRKKISVIDDQFGSPTAASALAQQLVVLAEAGLVGVCHATAEGYCTWYELAYFFLSQMKITYRLTPCSSKEFVLPAPRPKNSILENSRLKTEGLNRMGHWQTTLEAFVDRYRQRLLDEATLQQRN